MRYDADELWPIPGRLLRSWICTMDLPDGTKRYLRGFDLVMDGDQITLNEVYTHDLAAAKP